MKRIFLFLLTNLAVMLVLSVSASVLGLNQYLTASGLDMQALLVFCALFGFGGAGISLLISKPMAKWTTGARVIDGNEGNTERWLVHTVRELADKAGITCPEVAVFEGEPNAFATGAFRNSALVAVSTGLLSSMRQDEVRAVLAHEVAHIANGDMQTMTLLQGVINTFVMFAARVIGYAVDKAIFRTENNERGAGYAITVFVLDLVLGLLASIIVMAFSRHREYRADWDAAKLLGSAAPMQSALARLDAAGDSALPKQVAAFGISGSGGLLSLFRSHPPIADRIAALDRFSR
jgi:heat shock protein HtpX